MTSSRPQTSNADEEQAEHSRQGLRAYLPHTTDDTPIATRGQHLPALLHSLSYSGTPRRTPSWRYLTDLGAKEDSPKKQAATSVRSQRRYSGSSTEDDDGGVSFGRRPFGSSANLSDRMDRRQSNAMITLMTPEMRSQRLIGNSNPRYRWWVFSVCTRLGRMANAGAGSSISRRKKN